MGNFFSDLFYGKDPEIMTKTVVDPSKQAVSNPLSSFLASEIGQGIPRYGKDILTPLPQGGGASVQPFLGKTVDQLYGDIKTGAVNQFKNQYSDLLEGSAGALSSSSRAYNDNTALTNLNLGLADKRAALELGLPQAQLQVASGIKDQLDKEASAQYQDWLKSLPEFNPVLDKAINYLNSQTSTGSDILSALDPGKKAGIYDLIQAGASVYAASQSGGTSKGSTAKAAA